jgi:glycerol-3-phosphate acyltransferase PlsX
MEGVARFINAELRNTLTSGLLATLGAVLARPALLKFRERMSPTPAAPFLGLNGIVVKCHGGASDSDFAMAIRLAADLARSDFSAEIERNMRRLPDALAEPAPAAADGPVVPKEPPPKEPMSDERAT